MTPFQALYGRPPPTAPCYTSGSSSVASIDQTLIDHQRLLALLKDTLVKTRQRMIENANKHRLDKEFQVGELVYLRLRVYRQSSVARRDVHKLSRRYFGPFRILERIGKVAYRLDLPKGSRIHPVFHVSLLRPSKGDSNSPLLPLPECFDDDRPIIKPEAILDTRTVNKKGKPEEQVLVKWKGQDISEATWERRSDLDGEQSDLEDKAIFRDGGIDTTLRPEESIQARQSRPNRIRKRPARLED